MTDNSDPFASFFEKKDKKAKGKKVKNVVATDELAERLQRAAVREQKANQSIQAPEGIMSQYSTAVEILDEDDEYAGGGAVVPILDDEDSEQRRLERNNSTAATATSKANPWALPPPVSDRKNATPVATEANAASSQSPAIAPGNASEPVSNGSSTNVPVTIPDPKLAIPTSADATATQSPKVDAEKVIGAEKPAAAKYVSPRVHEAMASGQNTSFPPSQRAAPVAGGAYKPPGMRESNDVRSFSNDVRSGPLSGNSGGAYVPPSQRGGDSGTGAPTYFRRTAAPNIQSENDFPTL